jgi:hypothetical protein
MFIVFSPVWALARLELGWNLVLKLLASTAANSVGSLSTELGFTRVRHLKRPKSDKSDFGWERDGVRG